MQLLTMARLLSMLPVQPRPVLPYLAHAAMNATMAPCVQIKWLELLVPAWLAG